MKTLNEEDKPALNDKAISQIVVDTLVSATKKSDTKNRLEDALKTTPVSPKKIADALAPSKITGSQSTTTSKSTKGTTGSKPTGSKSISDNNDSNQTNSNVSETIYNKGKNMRKKINENEQAPTMSSVGQNVAKALDKTPGLDAKLDKIKDKTNAIKSILDYSDRFDVPNVAISALLTAAAAEAKKKETKAPAPAPAPAPVSEFVSYLFEGTER
jgi:hypothetical protein